MTVFFCLQVFLQDNNYGLQDCRKGEYNSFELWSGVLLFHKRVKRIQNTLLAFSQRIFKLLEVQTRPESA